MIASACPWRHDPRAVRDHGLEPRRRRRPKPNGRRSSVRRDSASCIACYARSARTVRCARRG